MANYLKFIKDRISKIGGTEIATSKSIVDAIGHDGTTALDTGLDAKVTIVDTVVDAIKLKTELMNSVSGSSTLNDANTSDTIVPSSLPTKIHIALDISTIVTANDDFTLEVEVGVSGSERVVGYYKITSDGTNTTIDAGSGVGAIVKTRRIDISDVMVYTGEQVVLDYTKSSGTDRNILYRYVCGV